MSPILLTGPALEPVSLAEAKAWLRVDGSADDTLISGLITAARLMLEAATRSLFVAQSWRILYDSWPDRETLAIPLAPFRSLDALRVYNAADVASDIAASTYVIDSAPMAPRIAFLSAPAAPERRIAGIQLDVSVGYGALAADVPAPLRQAIQMMVARFFENRGDIASEPLPAAVSALIGPYRRARLV